MKTVHTAKQVAIFSCYKTGGGTPFDSFWYSREAGEEQGVLMETYYTGDLWKGLRAIAGAERVIFDGYSSIAWLKGWALISFALLRRVPVAVYWHETDWYFKNWPLNRKPTQYKPLPTFLKYRSHLMPIHWLVHNKRTVHFHVCDYGKRMMHGKFGYPDERIHMLKNLTGAYQQVLDLPLGAKTVPYRVVGLSKVDQRKRPDLFMQVAKYVVERKPEAEFHFIGRFTNPPHDQNTVEQQVKDMGLEGKLHFVGEQRPPFPLLESAQVFLHTAEDDPSPKVVMEALGLGKYIASFAVGGIPEIYPDADGLVPFGEVEQLGEKVLAGFDKMEKEQQTARREYFATHYTPEAFAKRFREAIDWWDDLNK
ncbi:MAG TPA: hypothetical protein DCE41_13440 [Cytophagales bacterium]|nr:hypothetical protein [Cytophagales bacterium]HAA19584.1 hypothetical protein [Cytophagales bacterium]HAP58758.1 hypothetical protein [Cytophagales bacterium]